MSLNRRLVGFAAFTALFAVLAAIVFWGAWSPTVSIVAPDDEPCFLQSYGDIVQRWWNMFLTTGKMQPTDVFWSGLLGSPLVVRELKFAVSAYFSAVALAWFLRGRGLTPLASYGAGIFLGFSGYWLTLYSAGHGSWFVWMSYGVFAFGLIDRALERGNLKYWLGLGLALAWASFYQPDIWLLFTLFTFAYFLFRLISSHARLEIRKLVLCALVFFAVGAPSFCSAIFSDLAGRDRQIEESKKPRSSADEGVTRYGENDARWIFVTNWSLPPAETLEFLWPRLSGDTSCPMTLSINAKKGIRSYTGALGRPFDAKEGNYRQHSLYVGLVTCLFALVALCRLSNSTVRFFALAAVVFWLFSLGRYCAPIYSCVYALPFGDYLRAPVKWHHLTEFCLCVLAGFGIETLIRRIETLSSLSPRTIRLACGAVVAFVLFGAFDLATEAHRFCAPVDYSKAVAKKCSSSLTILSRRQFQDPQIAGYARAGYIVSVANWLGSPDAYLVQILQPLKPVKPVAPKPIPLTLGLISVCTAFATLGSVFYSIRHEKV